MKTDEILKQMREIRHRLLQVEHDIDRIDARIQEVAMFGVSKSGDESKKAFTAKRHLLSERLKLKRDLEDLQMEITLSDHSK